MFACSSVKVNPFDYYNHVETQFISIKNLKKGVKIAKYYTTEASGNINLKFNYSISYLNFSFFLIDK